MIQKLRRDELQANLSSVCGLLQSAKKAEDRIGIYQYSKLRTRIEEELSSITNHLAMASVAIFFGGDPVFGSHAISIDFAGNILERFQNLISSKYALEELGSLGERGTLPMKDASNLMMTSLAKGSFGFVLDEIADQTEFVDTKLKTIVDEVSNVLEFTGSPNQSSFDTIVESLDNRFLISLQNFFSTLNKAHATFRLVEDNVDFTLDHESISRAYSRTKKIEIEESFEEFTGKLDGFLPEHKKFELNVGQVLLYGSVSKEAVMQYKKSKTSNNNLIDKICRVRIIKRTILTLNGQKREVYKLIEFLDNEEFTSN